MVGTSNESVPEMAIEVLYDLWQEIRALNYPRFAKNVCQSQHEQKFKVPLLYERFLLGNHLLNMSFLT